MCFFLILAADYCTKKGDKSVPELPDCVSFIPGVGVPPERRGTAGGTFAGMLQEHPGVWTVAAAQAV